MWCSSNRSGCSTHLTLRRYSSAVKASASKSGSPGATGRDWRMPNSLQQEAHASASSRDQHQLCRMLLSLAMALPKIAVCIPILITAGGLCEIIAMQLIMLQ